jgi:tetratricopeptide (TPR) repeat protein
MSRFQLRPIAVVAALALAACRPSVVGPAGRLSGAERLAELERAASAAGASPAVVGQAAAATWLVTGDPKRARVLADRALAADAAEPWSLLVRMLDARETFDHRGSARAAVALLRGAPASPLAELAATRLYALSQGTPSVDAILVDGLSGLSAGSLGLTGRAAARAREALVAVHDGRNEDEAAAALRATLGTVTEYALVGPLGALRLRDFDAPSPFAGPPAPLASSYASPAGPVAPRRFRVPSGLLALDAESWRGEVYEAFSDVDVASAGTHLVSLRGSQLASVWVDGVLVASRRGLTRREGERTWAAVELPRGRHRIRVRFSRVDSSFVALSFPRADGGPAVLTFSAPAVGAAPPAPAPRPVPAVDDANTLSRAGARLADDPSDLLSLWVKVLALLPDDAEAARAVLPELVALAGESDTLRLLRVDLTSTDPDLPRSNEVALTGRDLDAVLAHKADWPRALKLRLDRDRADKRQDDAVERLSRLAKAIGEQHPTVLVLRARLAADRNDLASARRFADAALAAEPGACDALELRAGLARREDELDVADRLVAQLAACPGGLADLAGHHRSRGRLALAVPLLERLVARNPSSASAREVLADLHLALNEPPKAIAALEPLVAAWPRRAETLARIADLHEFAGDFAAAAAAREAAAKLDGSDLRRRRVLELDRGAEALDWAARDGLAAIRAYLESGFRADALAVQVLDLGALEVQPDGSSLERIHSIVQVLDKRGIDKFGEVSLPGDAQPLRVRTVKRDGRVLEAELIHGKEDISLPNLEPGDFAEYEFLRASGPRSLALPGWQGSQFLFQGPDIPFYESAYRVRVPASLGMELDANALPDAPPPVREGDWLVFDYARKASPAYVREPLSVGDGEVLPWVELGSGADTAQALLPLAESLTLKARATGELDAFVAGTRVLPPRERVRVLVDRLREAMKGDSTGTDLSDSAASAFVRGRGNRLLVLKAVLAAAGIPSHAVLARPFSANPRAFRFPHHESYSVALLRIDLPEGPTWMDFSLRQAPLGRLPAAYSGLEAFVLPEPGESVVKVTLPAVDPSLDRTDSDYSLALGADGTLTGTLVQTAHGFDAASLRRRLEQTNAAELRKQQERGLSGTFRGVVLEGLDVEDSGGPDSPVVLRSTLRVPRYGQRPDGTVALPAHFGAQQLGPRLLGRADRRTPMLLGTSGIGRTTARLQLPANASVGVPAPVEFSNEFGRFEARWRAAEGALTLEETVELRRARIAPERYAGLKQLVTVVDGAQAREIPIRL